MTTPRALVWTSLVVLGLGVSPVPLAAGPAIVAEEAACHFTKASDDAANASLAATLRGDHVAALRYEAQSQTLDEQSASNAGSVRLRAACFADILVSGASLVQNEVRYGQSGQAWLYARHLASIWQTYRGYNLSPAEQADYDAFFVDIAQALRACFPGCPISDREATETKSRLLEQP